MLQVSFPVLDMRYRWVRGRLLPVGAASRVNHRPRLERRSLHEGPEMKKERILLVEAEEASKGLSEHLRDCRYEVDTAETFVSAEESWRRNRPDLVVIGADLPDGLISRLVPRLRAMDSSIPVIVLASHTSIGFATEAVRQGAEQFLTKPVQAAILGLVIDRSLENRRHRRLCLAEMSRCKRRVQDPFVGRSSMIKSLQNQAHRLALVDSPVLIQGETGTGKGVLARWLHQNGRRASEPFVELNCACSRGLVEGEMFGDERATASRGPESKLSALEAAHRGTIFLDSIDNLDPLLQPKVLQLLKQKQFRRVGSGQHHPVDIRLIGASHRPLNWLLQQRRFRDESSFPVQTLSIDLQPLRHRVEDIPALASSILNRLSEDMGTDAFELSRAALSALQGYSWPGNIRELSLVLKRAVLVASDTVLTERDLGFDLMSEQNLNSIGHLRTLEEFERHYIHQVLRKEGGHVESAARKLGIPRSSLYHKLKQYRDDQPA